MAETYKKTIGNEGEEIAAKYIIKNNYKIIKRNYREKYGEIDIISKDSDGSLVFIEVKTMVGLDDSLKGLIPEDNFTRAKLKKMQRICQVFANNHQKLIDEENGWRMDLIAILFESEKDGAPVKIRHYKNI